MKVSERLMQLAKSGDYSDSYESIDPGDFSHFSRSGACGESSSILK